MKVQVNPRRAVSTLTLADARTGDVVQFKVTGTYVVVLRGRGRTADSEVWSPESKIVEHISGESPISGRFTLDKIEVTPIG